MKILIFFALSVFLFGAFNYVFARKKKYRNVILLLFLFSISFNINFSYLFHARTWEVPVHSVFFFLIACLIFVANKSTFKIGFVYLLFVIFAVHFYYELHYMVYDYVKYFRSLTTYASILIIYLIFRSLSTIEINKIFYSINYLAIFNGLLGLAQTFTGKALLIGSFNEPILYTEGLVAVNRAFGLAGSNNAAGNFSALLFGIVLYNFLKRKNALSLMAVILTMIFSALTLTRIGIAAILFEIALFYLFYKPTNKRGSYLKIFIFTFGIPLTALLSSFFVYRIIEKLFTQRGNTTGERFKQYERIFDYAIPNNWLFGIGDGQYANYLVSNYRITDIDIHSQYLNVLTEQGVFFFVFFVLFNFWLLFKILSSKSIERNLKTLGFSIFVANIICSNFNPNQYYYLNNVLYYLIIFGIYFNGKRNERLNDQ